ncbi:PRC-barrel domain-containing protein [Novosphingobium terrae]|uniref:PRC-barrel domain-containing protein n=1 Tax=Novosphingobium terrae TaxID=2726189 RepID=UPI002AC31BA5|nr:PRC-barrel domain-containing protein [Novosphingobium terrae]
MILDDLPAWIAPAATMIAAIMTAANLGARVTGWSFVVFTLGSVCWSWVGIASGQTNLLASNGLLTIVNLVGIWRWLGRQRAYEDGGKSAADASRRSAHPTLFAGTQVDGMEVRDCEGNGVGQAVEALISCKDGLLSYIVVRSGGIGGMGEDLRAVPRAHVTFSCDHVTLRWDSTWFASLGTLQDGRWPVIPDVPAPAESDGS